MKFKRLYKTNIRENKAIRKKLMALTNRGFCSDSCMRDYLRDYLENAPELYIVWMATHRNKPVAWAIGREEIRGKFYISVYVAAKYRKRGLGRELVLRVMRSAHRRGLSRFVYYAHDDSSSAFWRSMYPRMKGISRRSFWFLGPYVATFEKKTLSRFLNQRKRISR